MKKIVLLPLDERPCNYNFPYKLFNKNRNTGALAPSNMDLDFQIIKPDKLGDKKTPANTMEIQKFLKESCKDADGLVISIDTLAYGGLIPSRLHHSSAEEIQERLEIIKELKKDNEKLKIYAFHCIMRCPKYSSNDEEPDYYEECGAEIHKIGELEHKARLGMDIGKELDDLYKKVKSQYLEDYTGRRKVNLSLNLLSLDYVKEGYIDFLIIPQDDSAKYGFTAMDQEIVREKITKELLQDQVLMYPGADEVAMTLLTRVINNLNGRTPNIYIKYASIHAPYIIPAYEDRSLGETLKYQIMAAGCMQTESSPEADLILAVSAPAGEMLEASAQPVKNQNYCVERNLTEFVLYIEEQLKKGKAVTIGDNAFANGSDLELIALLNKRNLLMKVAGYAGWNTSSNTLGTAISQGVLYLYRNDCKEHRDFLVERYIEDAGYCGVVRKYITEHKLESLGMNYFDVKESNGIASTLIREMLQEFVDSKLSSIAEKVCINQVYMPWRRMFEIGIDANYKI
ncbi:DUF4127 family protein [Anaerocolumna aminovalerica]|uniref:DUF4127 family protein n=1 Tax=Anaerocolumna aminovalerica TaxID=1527 RepID=UPI000BE428AF|nr:DUF4127 family protein [Anaerocolumna aminovalerica]